MSSRRAKASTLSPEEINDLILKLQTFLPDSGLRCSRKIPASKILKDIRDYIKRLHREVNDLSNTLARLLASRDIDGFDPEILTRLLQQ